MPYQTDHQKIALIYCRVSDKKQDIEGSGLESQEHNCRQHAASKGYRVEKVFKDKVTGGSHFTKRKGLSDLIAHIDANPDKKFIVVFDDIKRYSRETEFYLNLRRLMIERGVERESPNFRFEDTPEGKLNETVTVAAGTYERESMKRQNRQRSIARIEQGYWVFRNPIGYEYAKSKNGGKELVKVEPLASIVKEALEGFASGRFSTQTELRRFLEAHPHYPKDLPNGTIRPQSIPRLLQKIIYAGYVEAPVWGISPRLGKHEALISYETYKKIQDNLKYNGYAPTRKDIRYDFPLRGAVACACCNMPFTAGWSKGKSKKYPYYLCKTKGCDAYGKSIARKKIEGEFEAILSNIQPSENVYRMGAEMFKMFWNQQADNAKATAEGFKDEAAKLETQISKLVKRIMTVTNDRVSSAIEREIEELESQKLVALEKSQNTVVKGRHFDALFEHSMKFLANPWNIWRSGRFDLQRSVLKLTFSDHLLYSQNEGFRTPKTTLPFKALAGFSGQKSKMVPLDGKTSNELLEVLEDWGHQLKHSEFERFLATQNNNGTDIETADMPSPGGLS